MSAYKMYWTDNELLIEFYQQQSIDDGGQSILTKIYEEKLDKESARIFAQRIIAIINLKMIKPKEKTNDIKIAEQKPIIEDE